MPKPPEQTAFFLHSITMPPTSTPLPLSYCTNVHPGRTLDEVLDGLSRFTLGIRQEFGQPLAAGLWLAASVIRELHEPANVQRLKSWLRQHELPCYTLNAFPFGDFHSERVKEQVYLPDWTTTDRRDYTLACATVLAQLLPDGVTVGSLSTVPLGFKLLATAPQFEDQCIARLLETAVALDGLCERSGRSIRLALEPEPCCVLETTLETLAFFERLRTRARQAGLTSVVSEHLGVCYDVCHQAVEFEDIAESITALTTAEIPIHKVHLSCAIEAPRPWGNPTVLSALQQYIEPRYLHQTFAEPSDAAGSFVASSKPPQWIDLDLALLTDPPAEFQAADRWRVHFHVPLDAERLGPLGTTRPALETALQTVSTLGLGCHLEVETYTWEVLPGGGRPAIVNGLARELTAASRLLSQTVRSDPA
jgi:sugar phosphate isomerase/epimerase